MDETKNNEIDKYLETLPDNVTELVHDKVWPKRVDEIAAKYSLNDEQKSALQDIVLFVLVGMESPETFGASLETELGISELLVEQILADLDERVFQYAAEFIEKQNNPDESTSIEVRTPFDILDKQIEEVEIAPNILPLVESDEERKKVMAEIPANLPGMPVETKENGYGDMPSTKDNIGSGTPIIQEGTFVGSEFAQKPIAVPRFNAVSAPETVSTTVPPTSQNPVAPADKKPEIQNPPRYTSDPYREPIE